MMAEMYAETCSDVTCLIKSTLRRSCERRIVVFYSFMLQGNVYKTQHISCKPVIANLGLGYPRGYRKCILRVRKTSYRVCKIEKKYYLVVNTEKSRPDLGLMTGDSEVMTFDLGAPFISPLL
jgi:hypothetical protein